MTKSKIKFYKKWLIKSFEYIFRRTWIWCMLQCWWHEWNEYVLHISLFFVDLWIKPIKKKKSKYIKWMWNINRSFWININKDRIELWYGRIWFPPESYWTYNIYYWNIIDKIFGKKKFSKKEWERKEFEIYIPDMYKKTKANLHKYKYRYETRIRRRLWLSKKHNTTSIEILWDAPIIPWKWTCSYNQEDDCILWYYLPWHMNISEIKKYIQWDIEYHRNYYPL